MPGIIQPGTSQSGFRLEGLLSGQCRLLLGPLGMTCPAS